MFWRNPPHPSAKISTWEPYTKVRVLLRLLTITTVLFTTVSSAVADSGAACLDLCTCNEINSYVSSVKCSYLGLSDIPAMLQANTVHTLDVSNNEIRILRNTSFSNYSRLSVLILSNNEVDEILPNAFAGLLMMRVLDLRYNKLQSFNPKIISANTVLEKVYLQGNPIGYLPEDSPILISASVSFLDLSDCSLTSVNPTTFSRLPNLYSLDISSNLLQTISLNAFDNVTKLSTLKLNNNRWACDCDTLEVMKRLTERQQAPAHKPVRCLEEQKYRKFWSTAGGSQPCNLNVTTEALEGRESELTTGTTVVLPRMHLRIPHALNLVLDKGLQRAEETTATSETDIRTAPESENGGCGSTLTWNSTTLTICVILPIALGCSVFLALVAMHYFRKGCKVFPLQSKIQERDTHNSEFFSNVSLLNPQITDDGKKQKSGYVIRDSYEAGGPGCHVYERID